MCNKLTEDSCPLFAGKRYSASESVVVPPEAASYSFNVKARLVDENNNAHFCLALQIKAVKSWFYSLENVLENVESIDNVEY